MEIKEKVSKEVPNKGSEWILMQTWGLGQKSDVLCSPGGMIAGAPCPHGRQGALAVYIDACKGFKISKPNYRSPSKNPAALARELSSTCKGELGERKYCAQNEMS